MRFIESFKKHAGVGDKHSDGTDYSLSQDDPHSGQPVPAGPGVDPGIGSVFQAGRRKKKNLNPEAEMALSVAMGRRVETTNAATKEASLNHDTSEAIASQDHWVYNEGGNHDVTYAKNEQDRARRARYLRAKKNVL